MEFNLADLFECVATRVPARPAVVWGDTRLTFGELDDRATRLAHGWNYHVAREIELRLRHRLCLPTAARIRFAWNCAHKSHSSCLSVALNNRHRLGVPVELHAFHF